MGMQNEEAMGNVHGIGPRSTEKTASSCISISSSCISIIFKIPIIDMSKLQNYPCCYKKRFSMKGVRCISEQR